MLVLPTLPDHSPDPSAGHYQTVGLEAKNQTGALPDCFTLIDPCSTFARSRLSSGLWAVHLIITNAVIRHHRRKPTTKFEALILSFFFSLYTSTFCVFLRRTIRLFLLLVSIVGCYHLLLSTFFQNRTSLRVAHMIALQNPALLPSAKVDISLLLKPQDEEERSPPGTTTTAFPSRVVPSGPALPPMSIASSPVSGPSVPPPSITKIPASVPAKRLQPAHTAESPAKKQSKWSPEEDALIIELRGSGMKWEDISRRLPGRSAISCRLHYQNYLERRSEWDEDKKNKLARLYERYVLSF